MRDPLRRPGAVTFSALELVPSVLRFPLRFCALAVAVPAVTLATLRVGAQSPAILQAGTTARLAALADAGVARDDSPDARVRNPALLASASGPARAVDVGYFRAEISDVVGIRAGGIWGSSRLGAVSLDLREEHVERLFDDPALAAERGLRVASWSIRLGYARSFGGGRGLVGASAERASSTVFGTEGSGWAMRFGGVVHIVKPLSIGVAFAGLGPRFVWKDVVGARTRSPLERAAILGLHWSVFRRRGFALSLSGDQDISVESRTNRALRTGAELQIVGGLSLRGGLATERTAGTPVTRSPSAGIGIVVRGLQVDLARDRINSAVGERTLLGMALRW